MKKIATILIASLLMTSVATFAQERDAWRKVAESIPLGSKVKVQTVQGRRFTGTLMRVDDQGISIKKSARIPEAATIIPYDSISIIERDGGGGMGWGKAIGIGLAAGASAIVTIFILALQMD